MKKHNTRNQHALSAILAVLSMFLAAPFAANAARNSLPVFEIPKCEDIVIDGNDGDWNELGFDLDIMPMYSDRRPAADDFQPSARLGWNSRGIVALFRVSDDVLAAPASAETLFKAETDCVGLYVISSSRDAMVRVAVSVPRRNEPESPWAISVLKAAGQPMAQIQMASVGRTTDEGYLMEVLVPWDKLGYSDVPLSGIRVQVFACDSDEPGSGIVQALWFPYFGTFQDYNLSYPVKLTTNASPRWLSARAWRIAAESEMLGCPIVNELFDTAFKRWPEDEARLKYERALHLARSDSAAALTIFRETAELSRSKGDTFLRAEALFRVGLLEDTAGEQLPRLHESLNVVRKEKGFRYRYLENRLLLAIGLTVLGSDAESDKGIGFMNEAYALAKAQGFTEFYPQIEGALGRYSLAKGDKKTAEQRFRQMIELSDWQKERAYARKMIETVHRKER